MDILWKGIVGGLVTAAIVFLSRRGNTLPGILPLFPTFALIGLLIIGAKGDQAAFRETCIAGANEIASAVTIDRSVVKSRTGAWIAISSTRGIAAGSSGVNS